MISINAEDVKWDTKEEVVTKIMDTENHLRITVVTPVKDNQKAINSECDGFLAFPPSSSRTSFSSLSSTGSDTASSSGSEKSRVVRKGSLWSVLKIIDKN